MPVHPTAIVDEKADIHETADIGPFCIVKAGVKIGKNVKLQSNVVIEGKTEIGEGTSIFPFACIGMPPQDIKYKGEETGLKIGGNNLIREYVTIHRASVSEIGRAHV